MENDISICTTRECRKIENCRTRQICRNRAKKPEFQKSRSTEIQKRSNRGPANEKAVSQRTSEPVRSQWKASEVSFSKKNKKIFKINSYFFYRLSVKIFIYFQSIGSQFSKNIVYIVARLWFIKHSIFQISEKSIWRMVCYWNHVVLPK